MVFAFLFFPLIAAADPCDYQNLYDHPHNPIHAIPIYDQSELGTCYAYSASQLIDYELRSSGEDPLEGKGVSPIWTAFNHKSHASRLQRIITNSKDTDSLEYSSIKWAIDDIRHFGICKSQVVEASLNEYKIGHAMTHDEFIFIFSKLWKKRRELKNDDLEKLVEMMSDDPDVQAMLSKISARLKRKTGEEGFINGSALPSRYFQVRQKHFLNRIVSDLKGNISAKKQTKALLSFLREVLFSSCEGDNIVYPNLPKLKHFGKLYSTQNKIKGRIDEVFNDTENPRPVAVGYCSGIYKEEELRPDLKRVPILPRVLQLTEKKNCSPHYSILVGKRPNKTGGKNSCDYLLRNSYGTGFWTKRYECYCEEKDGRRRDCSYEADRDVPGIKVLGCWIDGHELNRATFDVVYFDH